MNAKGYRSTGEYRAPKKGEYFLPTFNSSEVYVATTDFSESSWRHIVEKLNNILFRLDGEDEIRTATLDDDPKIEIGMKLDLTDNGICQCVEIIGETLYADSRKVYYLRPVKDVVAELESKPISGPNFYDSNGDH